MSEALNYASLNAERRWSRMASYAVGISILQIPAFFMSIALASTIGPKVGELGGFLLLILILGLLFVSPLTSIILGITASIRSRASRGTLQGGWAGVIAIFISAAWPVGVILFALSHMPVC